MTFDLQSKSAQDSLHARATLALRVVVAVSLAAACVMALADSPAEAPDSAAASARDFGEVDLEQLEQVFWFCDHAASTDGVDGPTGMACGTATEALMQRRFDGNFSAMLRWWQGNKDAMHQALSQSQQQAETQAAEASAQVDDYPMP
jgi:hypothetical protein